MLQWMGGSRRKVTTSRMSTQKRQKQYFEQRKRQQQQTFGQDSYSDKPNTPNQHQNYNRSLDILSLLNMPSVDLEDNSSCPSVRNLEGESLNRTTYSYQNSPCPPALQKNQFTAVDPVESDPIKFMESSYKLETVYPKKSSISYPDNHNKCSSKDGGNIDQLKFSKHHQLSVLDMLGDDGPNCSVERNSGHEAHVAFSLEGLGKVETETPVHSPRPTGRTISCNHISPLKVTKQDYFSKKLSSRLYDLVTDADDTIQDHDIPFLGNSSDRTYYSRDAMDPYSKNPKQKISSVENIFQLDDSDFNLKNAFGNEEVYYNRRCETEHMWNDSRFVDTNFLDEDESGLSWKNWNWEKDSNSANYFNIKNHDYPDFNFESPCLQKKRVFAEATNRFSLSFSDLDSPLPYFKYQVSENDHDFLTQNETWHTTSQRNDFSDVINPPPWSSSRKEEEKDSWSLLSEESCSSAAVRDQATEKQSFEPTRIQKKTYNHKTNAQLPNYFRRENIPSDTSKKLLDLDEDFLFDKRFKTTNTINSDVDCFKQNSPPGYRDRIKNPFTDDPKSFLDANLHSVESNSKTESQHWETYHVGFVERAEFSDNLVQRSVGKDGRNTSQTAPPGAAETESKEDACDPSNGSENSYGHIKEVSRTPEKKEILKTVCYPQERDQDTLSSVEIPDNSVDGKELQNGSQDSLPCQSGFNEIEVYRPNKNNGNEEKSIIKKNGEETCQVMMLESYVLQFLCMQKGNEGNIN